MKNYKSYVLILPLVACTVDQELGNRAGTPDAATAMDGGGPTAPNADAGFQADATTDSGAPDATVPNAKRVFVTSSEYTGDLLGSAKTSIDASIATGAQAADALCNEHARRAGLGGVWVAWISTNQSNAIDRLHDVGPWYLVDRATWMFPSKFVINQGPQHKFNMDELGATIQAHPLSSLGWLVWTSTDADGRLDLQPHVGDVTGTVPVNGCKGWTTASSGRGNGGYTELQAGGEWTAARTGGVGYGDCSERHRLYCFEN